MHALSFGCTRVVLDARAKFWMHARSLGCTRVVLGARALFWMHARSLGSGIELLLGS